VGLDRSAAGLVDLGDAVGDREVQRLGALVEPRAVLRQLEDLAAVGPLPLEHGAGVVQPVAQHMQVGLTPGHELAVEPDESVAVVIGDQIGHTLSPPGSNPGLDGEPCEAFSPAPSLTTGGKLPNLRAKRCAAKAPPPGA